MVNSAICTVNGSPLNTTGTTGANVSSGSTLTVALVNSAGVSSWSVLCTGVDELTNQAAINASLSQNNTTWTATFTMPTTSQGAAMQFSSVVNGGPANAANGGNSFIFGVFVLYDGYRLFFGGESNESNATVGNAADLNKAVRAAATGGFAAGGDLSGNYYSQIVDSAQSGLIVFTATTGNIEVASTATAPGLGQTTVATNSATGKNMSISAQSASGTTSTGGNVVLTPGTGTSTNGLIQLAPSNAVYNFEPAQGSIVNQSGVSGTYTGYIQTTDGYTVKNVLVIPIPTGKTMVANIMLVGRLSTGVTTYAQLIFGGAENASGTAALFTGSGHVFQNTATLYDTAYAAAGASGAGAVLAVSGANFEVTIAGVASTTINWTCVAEVVFC